MFTIVLNQNSQKLHLNHCTHKTNQQNTVQGQSFGAYQSKNYQTYIDAKFGSKFIIFIFVLAKISKAIVHFQLCACPKAQ